MASLNSISITGRAGKDPEVRYFENGTAVAELRVAVDRIGNDHNGERKKPLWITVKIWGKSAQVAADYVRKGSMIGISGRLDEETWTDRNSGQERSKPIIAANQLTLLGGRNDTGGGGGQGGQQFDGWGGTASDEEIPF